MKEKKKILVYNHIFFLISETFVYQQARDLAQNFDVHVLSQKFQNPHGFDCSMLKTHLVKRPQSLVGRALGKLIRYWCGAHMNISLKSFLRFRKLVKDHNITAIHAHFGPNAIDILGYAKAFNIPLMVTFHGHDASTLLRDKEYKEKLPELFDYATGIIIVSRHMIETLELGPWISKVHVIPCSVDPTKFTIQKNNKSSEVVKIAHSGRVVPTKGVPDLVKVFSELADKYDNIELHIAGDGIELEDSKELARKYGHPEKIRFYGRVSQQEVKDLLNDADIFVLNSRTDDRGDMEGTPVSIMEAMCLKKPVVSTIHAGIPDVIEHGKNGLLAKEYANEELKDRIEKLIQNPEMRKQLGAKAKETVEESYTNRVMQEKINKVFASL
ncbi:glycosyltransferase family 4 protein [Fodinibius saliphilus]|uniref:glycosyltransferase family 4 protein n=1 Tax=Fodinibius saliphilus TaxID=1920650 RepID=UPI001109887C|nr:glycosyltransferase family 4 protein [Fodinibius saliphilus]